MNHSEMMKYLDENNISDMKDLISILDHSYDGIVLSNKDGVIFYVNQAVERITGSDRRYFIGKNPKEYKRDGFVLKTAKKFLNNNVTHLIQVGKDGRIFLSTTVPIHFKGEMFYFSNHREINELNNLQLEVLEGMKAGSEFGFAEELKELMNIFSSKDIIIKSPVMLKIMKTVSKIAPTDVIVNLSGESGVGKDVIAKLIHHLSGRKGNPFIPINCGSIPENLLESELFGYSEGSFTGAAKKGKPGLLEAANSGTVFLDEIGDLPLNLQVKLLKVLQDQEIYRIGGRESIRLDIRIICATNQHLEQMIKEGRFREDLFFRINVMPIYIPPLKDRREDIVHLCQFFMAEYNKKYGRKTALSLEVCNLLEAYDWPGNVRELKSLIERLVIVSEGDKIKPEDLPESITKNIKSNPGQPFHASNLRGMISGLEKDIILRSIEKYGARQAASHLGIDYSTLKRKKKLYLSKADEASPVKRHPAKKK